MNQLVDGELLSDRFKNRIYAAEDNNLFINYYVDDKTHAKGAVFGDITMFSSGRMQAIIDAETDSPTANVEHLVAPGKKEFMSSIMYWMVRGNHIFILQIMAIRSDTVEDYLTWLLRDRIPLLPKDKSIVLINKFDPKKIQSGAGKTKSIIVGGSIRPLPGVSQKVETQIDTHTEVSQSHIAGWQQAREILAALVGSSTNVEKIMHSIPKDTELSVEVHIGFKTRKKKFETTPLSLLETGLRNMPDSFLEIEGEKGKKHSDGTLRLHHNAMINLYSKSDPGGKWLAGMFEHLDVLRAMLEAYDTFVMDGKIER